MITPSHKVNHKKEVNMPEISAPLSWVEIFLFKKVLECLSLVPFNLTQESGIRSLQNGPRGGRPDPFWLFSSYATQEEKRLPTAFFH